MKEFDSVVNKQQSGRTLKDTYTRKIDELLRDIARINPGTGGAKEALEMIQTRLKIRRDEIRRRINTRRM
jgi:hypothetical protein